MSREKTQTLIESEYALIAVSVGDGCDDVTRIGAAPLPPAPAGFLQLHTMNTAIYAAIANAYRKVSTGKKPERLTQDDYIRASCRLRVRVELVVDHE